MPRDTSAHSFTFSDEEMLHWLESLDVLNLKYGLNQFCDSPETQRRIAEIRQDAERLEHINSHENVRDDDADRVHGMLKLVYGDAEPIGMFVAIVHLVRDKLIGQLLSVDGLANLFNVKFYSYEWLLHLEPNQDDPELKNHYRDHFLHQVKDAFAAARLLEELPRLEDRILEDLVGANINVNAFLKGRAASMAAQISNNQEWNAVYEPLARLRLQSQGEAITTDSLKTAVEKEFLRAVTISSLVMAGLFHDIGYTIRYALEHKEELSEMVPTANFFIETLNHFSEASGILSRSLLFSVVDQKTIKKALDDNIHGALSAVAFLLYFYHSGAIHRMDPLDSAAVEVAALIIFDHTLQYSIIDKKEKLYRYHHPVYARNALSYILRFCDDIQEWGRVYFNIETNRSLRICKNCRMPIAECKITPLRDSLGNDESYMPFAPRSWRRFDEQNSTMYVCGCSKYPQKKTLSQDPQKKTSPQDPPWNLLSDAAKSGGFSADDTFSLLPDISYRKLNHIKTCTNARFFRTSAQEPGLRHDPSNLLFLPNYADDLSAPVPDKEAPDRLLLHIDYDPYKALQLCFVDPGHFDYRAKELNKIRKFLRNQKGFASIVLFAHTTNNPITLKVRILENFMNDWYRRFAKAEEVTRRASRSVYMSNLFLHFADCQRDLTSEIPRHAELLLRIHDEVLHVIDGFDSVPADNPRLFAEARRRLLRLEPYKLRIFMLLSENPRWSAEDIEAVPRPGDEGYVSEEHEYKALLELLNGKEKYRPHRMILRPNNERTHIIALLQQMYKLRYELRPGGNFNGNFKDLRIDLNTRDALISQMTTHCMGGSTHASETQDHLKLYMDLLLAEKFCSAKNAAKDEVKAIIDDNFKNNALVGNFRDHDHTLYGGSVDAMLDNFFSNAVKQPHYHKIAKGEEPVPESYYELYKHGAAQLNQTRLYCKTENYERRKREDIDMLDVHSDLYVFYCLGNI